MADDLSSVSQGFIVGIFESIATYLARRRSTKAKKRLLLDALRNSKYEWRTIETLQRLTRDDIETTRQLLREIGARPSELQREVWKID